MFQNLRARVVLILVAILVSAGFLYRNYMRPGATNEPSRQMVTLGLDLQGGSHYALELDDSRNPDNKMSAAQRADAVDRALTVVRTRVDALGVAEPIVQKAGNDRIIVELPGLKEQSAAKDVLQKTAFLEFQIVRPVSELQEVLPRLDGAIARVFPDAGKPVAGQPATPAANPTGGLLQTAPRADSAGADSTRDSAGVAAATTTPVTPGNALTSRLAPGPQGSLIVKKEDEAVITRWLAHPDVRRALPRGTTLLWGVTDAEENKEFRSLWFVESEPIMTGASLEDAKAEGDQFGRPVVTFELNRAAGRAFEKATGEHINEQMAIVLDQRVYTAPSIRSQIGARGQIDMGSAKLEDASSLALVLRAGALPAPLRIVEERSVGPSLGADSIQSGILAGAVGIGLVVLIMVGVYKRSGFLSVIALAIYVLLTLGMLAALNATLTFPGIAGFILSIGMAVDANVLIFERIREELDHGRNVRTAINEGFHHALRAIVDSAATTLITCAILFYTGTGPIRGFAVTLAIGVVASMFTAIFTTRTLMMLDLGRQSAASQKLSI